MKKRIKQIVKVINGKNEKESKFKNKNVVAYEGKKNIVSWRKKLIRNGRNKE